MPQNFFICNFPSATSSIEQVLQIDNQTNNVGPAHVSKQQSLEHKGWTFYKLGFSGKMKKKEMGERSKESFKRSPPLFLLSFQNLSMSKYKYEYEPVLILIDPYGPLWHNKIGTITLHSHQISQ